MALPPAIPTVVMIAHCAFHQGRRKDMECSCGNMMQPLTAFENQLFCTYCCRTMPKPVVQCPFPYLHA